MNKEVIYLEPEDDITDILTKLQQAEQKLVALVPPKKATVLRSAVNMKLVARAAKECDKVAVIVTPDPAIAKMAIAARVPIAKTLQSRPIVPTKEAVAAADKDLDTIEEDDEDEKSSRQKIAKKSKDTEESTPADLEFGDNDLNETTSDSSKSAPKDKDAKKPKKPVFGKPRGEQDKIRRILTIAIPSALVLILLLVWAFVFAPAATITVAISSTTTNIAENIHFTSDPTNESIAGGVLVATETKLEQKYTAEFEPTGEEDQGEKASGTITLSTSFIPRTTSNFSFAIPVGAVFTTYDGTRYVATSEASLVWGGDISAAGCSTNLNATCTITANVNIEAAKAGAAYNITSGTSWNQYDGLDVSNSSAITGGNTKMVKVVSKEDIEKAVAATVSEHNDEGRKYLYEDISKNSVPIEGSFKAEPGESTSKPAVGTPIEDKDKKASLTVTVKYSVLTVEKSKIEEFIKEKLGITGNQHLYSIGNPYFERYTAITEPAKLKTTIEVGPVVTEDKIFEKVKGHKIGEVQSLLKDIDGSVEVRTPYFWVWNVPEDRKKVTIDIKSEGHEA